MVYSKGFWGRHAAHSSQFTWSYRDAQIKALRDNQVTALLIVVTFCLGPGVNTVYKQAQKLVRPVGRTIYVISAIMAVLIVAFLSIIVYLKVQHSKSALPQNNHASSGSISKSTQSTLQPPSFDLKQSISEIKSCVFNQVSCVVFSMASNVYR